MSFADLDAEGGSAWPRPTPPYLRTWRAVLDAAKPVYLAARRKWVWLAAPWSDANPPAGVLPADILMAMARFSRDREYETEAGAWAALATAVYVAESENGKR
jgi:hypothetical protein